MNKQLCLLFISSVFCYRCLSQENRDTSINLFFKTNCFELDAQHYNIIKDFINSYSAITHINGYADTTGTVNYNLALSRRRAFAVYSAIKSEVDSLDANIVAHYGESKEFSESWMNRRVQIHAHKLLVQALEKNNAQNVSNTLHEINLDNLYFLPDKPILSQESVPYIQEVARQLKTFPMGTFEIIGHINYQSRFDSTHLRDLFELSKLRAKAVYDYLVEFGIPATRMTYKGVGNSQPIFVSPKNDKEKRKNMRVQIIIMKK